MDILAVLTGRAVPFRGEEKSAIAKRPRDGALAIEPMGLAGDEQADLVHHGGVDKAIHHYPFDHYPFWRAEYPDLRLLDDFGAFGENIAVSGFEESGVCIGDRFRLGTALVEISQGRQPCWKQGHRMNRPEVVARMVETRRTGWYYRVLEPGYVRAGDRIELIDRVCEEWPVSRVVGMLIGGQHDLSSARALASLDYLSQSWRRRAAAIVAGYSAGQAMGG